MAMKVPMLRFYVEEKQADGTWKRERDYPSVIVGEEGYTDYVQKTLPLWKRWGIEDKRRLHVMSPLELRMHFLDGARRKPTERLMNLSLDELLKEISSCSFCGKIVDKDVDRHVETFRLSEEGRVAILHEQCDMEKREQEFISAGTITTWLMTQAALEAFRAERDGLEPRVPLKQVNEACVRLQVKVKDFERLVWFAGLQKCAQEAKTKGTSFKNGDFSFLCYTMAGRVMVTLESPGATITVITDETSSESRMGIQGLCASETAAMGLLDEAIRLWKQGHRVVEDTGVSMGF